MRRRSSAPSAPRTLTAAILLAVGLSSGIAAGAAPPVEINGAAAKAKARALGLTLRDDANNGSARELSRFVNGAPQYLSTFNRSAQDTISVDEVQPGGSSGLGLTGQGVRVGIWDGGTVRYTHAELAGAVISVDGSPNIGHATHVGATIAGRGAFAPAEGMAPAASLVSYDWATDLADMPFEISKGMSVSNHSYGYLRGWFLDSTGMFGKGQGAYIWLGDASISATEDYAFGFYDSTARAWDQVAATYPNYLIVKAAGNDRGESGPGSGTAHYYWNGTAWASSTAVRDADGGTSGYDTLEGAAVAKNVLTVGAVADIIGGYTTAAGVVVEPYSNFGPTDDGRIKPDVVANGQALTSAWNTSDYAYAVSSGTSMAAPCVTGSVALLVQHYRALFGTEPSAALLKAIIIHTADEAGPAAGPDYKHGWGLINTKKAALLISDLKAGRASLYTGTLSTGQTKEWSLRAVSSPYSTLRITLSYTDPAGAVTGAALDSPARKLVNDLDIRVDYRESGPFKSWKTMISPWVLNPALPANSAARADNDVDNVERIDGTIGAITLDSFRLLLSAEGAVTGAQQYYIIVTNTKFTW